MVSGDRMMCCGKAVSTEALKEAEKVADRAECLQGILKIPVYLKNYIILR